MEIALTPEQELLIREAVESGRLERPEDVVQQALALWEETERHRTELLRLLAEGEADFAAGRFTEYDEEGLKELGEKIKREGRLRRASIAQ